jgi:2-methylcitrate dehydratase PrpD
MDNLNQEIASFVVDTRYEDLPAPVVHETKLLLLDSIGGGLAGTTADPGKMAIALAKRLGGPKESSIIGVGDKVSCTNAVFANGQLINTPDYDALMPGGHAPAYIIPPALAMAECNGASGRELILATALGFEVAARLASALPSASPIGLQAFRWQDRAGYAHCNFGASAGAGKLLKLDRDRMTHALGIAGHLCQVLTWVRSSFSEHRPMTKYGVPGWQNTGGVMAALLAEMGYMGDTTVFDPAEQGFWKFAGYEGWNPDKAREGLGKTWTFNRVNYKPYPCCRVLHPALECLMSIMEKNHLKPQDIEGIRGYLPRTVEAPIFTNRELTNIVDIQFGLPYILAVVAYGVKVGIEWQDMDTVRDPKMLKFAEKVTLHVHPETDTNPQLTALEVSAKGQVFKEEKTLPRGVAAPGLKMTDEELIEKFRHNAAKVLTEEKTKGAIKALMELETVSAAELMKQVTP